jgi:hypothetical protein
VLVDSFDLSKSYQVALYAQDDNGDGKSIQSILLEKAYAAGERAANLRSNWNSEIDPTLIDDRLKSLKTLDGFGVSFTNGASLSALHNAPNKILETLWGGDVDENGDTINLVVPLWGSFNFEEPEDDELLEQIFIIKNAGFKVKAYVNCENFVGDNGDDYEVIAQRWMTYCDTNTVVQAFINSQPFHTGVWNSATGEYDDASDTYPYRKYMFCYAEYILKDYAIRYGEYFDSWIFDDGATMEDNGDNATSGLVEEQRIYQAYANAVHAGNTEIPVAFNNGRSTTSYASYPYAHPVRFEDFTFGHAFGGNNNHAYKDTVDIGTGQFYSNYKYIEGMTATNGYVFTGNDWDWDDLIVGNFHSKVSTTAWKYGPTQAWEQDDFNQWNLEAMQAGGSMTWAGSYNKTVTTIYDWVYELLEGMDDYLAEYESPGAPNWTRAYTVLPDATVDSAYSHNLVNGTDFWDPEGDEITGVVIVDEDNAPSWLSISETEEGIWTLSGMPDDTITTEYEFTLRVMADTTDSDRTVNLYVYDPNTIVPVTSFAIASYSYEMYVDDTLQIKTEICPSDASDQSVIWECSDSLIAEVSDGGMVNAIDTGVVSVTATTVDGGLTQSCTITISMEEKTKCDSANVALCGVASQSSTDYSGYASYAIDGNTSGIFSDNTVTHTLVEDNPWWEVDLGLEYNIGDVIIYNRAGANKSRLSNFTITVYDADSVVMFSQTYADYPDLSETYSLGGVIGERVRVNLNDSNALSLAEVEVYEFVDDSTSTSIVETKFEESDVLFFPNPAKNSLNFYLQNIDTPASLSVYSITGQLMLVQEIENSEGCIDVSNLQRGVYVLKLTGDKTVIKHFVKE